MAPLVIGPFGEKWSYLLSLPNHDLLLPFLCPSSSIMPPKDDPIPLHPSLRTAKRVLTESVENGEADPRGVCT